MPKASRSLAKAATLTAALTVLVPIIISLSGLFYNWTKAGQLLVIIGEGLLFLVTPALLVIEALVFIAIYAVRRTDRKTATPSEAPKAFDPWE